MSKLVISHNVYAIVRDRSLRTLYVSRGGNLITSIGLNQIRDLIGGGALRPDIIAVGTGSAAATLADTTLGASVFSRTIDRRIPTDKRLRLEILLDFTEGNDNLISESALFKSTFMIARAVLAPVVNKTVQVQATLIHDILLANG